MQLFVTFKVYRQKDGEYVAVETDKSFRTKAEAEQHLAGKPLSWWETKPVPLFNGQTVQAEFMGYWGIHESVLDD